jgi:2-polyprenyl-3-methyl-5-hydroxy-6-metoxy-1,4-benzoquinol methylase
MRLAQQNADVVGIDFSSESINIAKTKNPNIQFLCMDYFDITNSLGLFDGIFSCSYLIHNTQTEIHTILNLIDSIIKPNGYFLIIYFKGEGQRITYPEINGHKIERIVQLYSLDKIQSVFYSHKYSFVQNGYLDPQLTKLWDSIIFQKH